MTPGRNNVKILSRRCFLICVVVLVLIVVPASSAQDVISTEDSVGLMIRNLDKKRLQRERLNRMIDALNQVDSVYKLEYPTWIVLDRDMRERIRRAFARRNFTVSADDEIVVVANQATKEILEIYAGPERMGRIDTYGFLSDSLHDEILAGGYAKRFFDPRPKKKEIGRLYGAHPEFAAVYASAFGAGMLFANGWGVEGKLGFEEIGYHFWSTGSLRALAVFDQLKIGIVMPIANGAPSGDESQPLDIRPRKMTGALGFASEFLAPFERESVSALFSIGDLTRITNSRLLSDSGDFYYLHTVAQLTYSREFDVGDGQLLLLTGGLGYHQMAHGLLQVNGNILTTDKEDFVSPVLRIDYLNRVSNMFGVSAHIYSGIAHLKGWVELIPNLFYIDLQYYAPVFRDPKPWEQSYFFMVSPRIQVIY